MTNQNIVNKAEKPFEDNFELTVFIKQGKQTTVSNFAACKNLIEEKYKYSAGKIESFEISKVIRDEDGEIVSSTLIMNTL